MLSKNKNCQRVKAPTLAESIDSDFSAFKIFML